jgi:hypothetical protein
MRFNPHYHCIVLKDGINETGFFHHIPLQDTAKLSEVFRMRVIKLFVDKGLRDRSCALKLARKEGYREIVQWIRKVWVK